MVSITPLLSPFKAEERGKQTIAGVPDIVTSIPAIPGLVYELGKAGFLSTSPARRDIPGQEDLPPDLRFQLPKPEFVDTLVEGIKENPLIQSSAFLRDQTNKMLGIGEPTDLISQIARMGVSSVLPLPDKGLTGKFLSSSSPAAITGRLLTPVARANEPGRFGAQIGLGIGLDQAIRLASGSSGLADIPFPSLISSAKAGELESPAQLESPFPEIEEIPTIEIPEVDLTPLEDLGVEVILPGTPAYEELEEKTRKAENIELAKDTALVIGGIAAALGLRKWVNTVRTKKAEESGVLGPRDPKLSPFDEGIKKIVQTPGLVGKTKATGKALSASIARVDEAIAAQSRAIAKRLADKGFEQSEIDSALGASKTLTTGQTGEFFRSGKYPQDVNIPDAPSLRGITLNILSLRTNGKDKLLNIAVTGASELTNRVMAIARDTILRARANGRELPPEYEDAFNQGDLNKVARLNDQHNQQIREIRVEPTQKEIDSGIAEIDPQTGLKVLFNEPSDISPGMWGANDRPIPSSELMQAWVAARSDPEIRAVMDKINEVTDKHLDYMVARDYLTTEQINQFKKRFTFQGQNMFFPLFDTSSPQPVFSFLSDMFRPITHSGEEMEALSSVYGRILAHGQGTQKPMSIADALRLYTLHMFEAVNRDKLKWETLTRLANVGKVDHALGSNVDRRIHIPGTHLRRPTQNGTEVISSIRSSDPDVAYVGKEVRDPITKETNFVYGVNGVVDDDGIKSLFDLNDQGKPRDAIKAAKLLAGRDMEKVMHRGEVHIIMNSDHSLRSALSMGHDKFQPIYNLARLPKRIGQTFTTGVATAFSPTALFYNWQTAITTMGLSNVPAVTKASVVGAAKLAKHRVAEETANYLAQKITTNTGLGRIPSMQKLEQALTNSIGDSLVSSIRREQGYLATGIDLTGKEFNSTPQQLFAEVFPNFHRFVGYGEMHLVWRMIRAFNDSMHGGTALGLTEKFLDGIPRPTSKQVREAAQKAGEMVGDVRERGSGRLMQFIHSQVPYSEPFVAANRVFLRAAVRNPGKFALAYGTYVFGPTIAELSYLTQLKEDGVQYEDVDPVTGEKVMKDYIDFYWNSISKDQKITSFWMPIPGKPPQEAMVFRIIPEWAPGRGFAIDTLDTIFGFSEDKRDKPMQDRITTDNLWAGLRRWWQVPSMRGSAIGRAITTGDKVDFEPTFEYSSNPEDPEKEMSLFRHTKGLAGTAAADRYGTTGFTSREFGEKGYRLGEAIFMGGMNLFNNMAQAFNVGTEPRFEGSSFTEGLRQARIAATDHLKKTQPMIFNPITDSGLIRVRPNKHDEKMRAVINKLRSLEKINRTQTNLGVTSRGSELPARIPDITDPKFLYIASTSGSILSELGTIQDQISDNQQKIDALKISMRDLQGNELSQTDKNLAQDRLVQLNNELRVEQNAIVEKWDKIFRTVLGEDDFSLLGIEERVRLPLSQTKPSSGIVPLRPPPLSQ